MTWNMRCFLLQFVDVCEQLAGPGAPTLRKVATAFIEQEPETEEDPAKSGSLAPVASQIFMTILYAARTARLDLLRATCYLATRIARWTTQSDKMLCRLVCYMSSLDLQSQAWIGDPSSKLPLCLYTDASLAGELYTHAYIRHIPLYPFAHLFFHSGGWKQGGGGVNQQM